MVKFLKRNEQQEEPKNKRKLKDALAKIQEQEAIDDQEEGFIKEFEINRLEKDKEILNKKVKQLEDSINTRRTDIMNLENQKNKLIEANAQITRSEEEDHLIRHLEYHLQYHLQHQHQYHQHWYKHHQHH